NSAMSVPGVCYGIFVDISNNLYCSMSALNQVVMKSLYNNSAMWIVAAGADCSAPSTNTLNGPRGIYVDTDLNLYVADCQNNRIQMFCPNSVFGITIAGTGQSGNGTNELSYPSD
ncbi:unnamed protein product, partial [Rotaria socialis]